MKNNKFRFKPGDFISTGKYKSKILEIEFLDYTRNVYIFKEPWVHNLSKFTSYNTSKIDKMFHLISTT